MLRRLGLRRRGRRLTSLPWTPADAERHAAAIAAFHALLSRDGGFKERRQDHRDAMRRVGEATVSFDWHFFAASRAVRAEATGRCS